MKKEHYSRVEIEGHVQQAGKSIRHQNSNDDFYGKFNRCSRTNSSDDFYGKFSRSSRTGTFPYKNCFLKKWCGHDMMICKI